MQCYNGTGFLHKLAAPSKKTPQGPPEWDSLQEKCRLDNWIGFGNVKQEIIPIKYRPAHSLEVRLQGPRNLCHTCL